MAEDKARTGFIGLGSQGGPMAQRMLDAGYPLTVWARRPEAADDLVAKGATRATSVAELGAACDHVGVCVVDDAGVEDICAQLLPAMKPGSVLVIHSTILPQTCERLAQEADARGISLLDAPVSGGGAGAATGTLTVMCGGSEAAFVQALPVMESFAGKTVLLGSVGSGQRAKIVNNALMAANMGLAHAALSLGEELGIDRGALADLIKHSSGRSFGFEVYARLPSPGAFAHGSKLLRKDVDLLGAIAGPDNALALAADPFLDAALAATEQPTK
ncbi:3-hydroxyisobutyrate dehydrogenase-like beta-hydroxyacid dehydrogenase [Novosphingobium sp. PhB165]|uniref:NAD(P)-dependent oxidoreductase n=1 Tax=Novosphingobium sp. PhB165 TaxID=2485105 RepID=UPI0010468F92|nr:NAD(P)-dependent oxidoreductase [Novosphingobium sp. PhB165]TCM21665.1 3-hydroxyisobutyrate dehydrogenase-like beta-hydroxyacid dehydrogenase [Novosphingobium sp. PhB165]